MSEPSITGGCACGAVTYRSPGPVKFALRCACRACQRTTGTGHAIHAGLPRARFEVTGTPATHDRTGQSGQTVTKVFCPVCGCPLFGLAGRSPSIVLVLAGSLDDPSILSPGRVLYREEAQPWDLLPPAPEE